MFPLKRLKPFVLLLSLNFLILLPLFLVLLANYENKVDWITLLRPNPSRHDQFDTDMNIQLSLLREAFKRTLSQYETSRTFRLKMFTAAIKSSSLKNLQLTGEISKQHIPCNNELFLLIQVHSTPKNFMSRQAIRLSWGSMDHYIGKPPQNINATMRSWKTVFLIGQSSNSTLNDLVQQEASIYKDIVIGSFKDTYRNLYMKMVFSLKWPLDQKCEASYILKTDEDCFVNVGNLLNWLRDYHLANGTYPLYAGRVQPYMKVIRDKESRYYVSEKDHPAEIFQPYVSGGGYVFSGSLLPSLAEVSQRSPLFANEDALLGSLMYRIGVKPTDNSKFLPLIFCELIDKDRFREKNMCALSRQIVLHGVQNKHQLGMHFNSALLNYFPSLCSLEASYENMRDHCQ